jgi:hypothetical protein
MSCAVLLASLLPSVQITDLNKSIVYEVPASFAASVSWSQRLAARACASKYGIRWRIAQGR